MSDQNEPLVAEKDELGARSFQPDWAIEAGAMQAAIALRNEGHDVVDFGPGEPDFDTPAHIKEAAARAMQAGQTKYTPTAGTKKFQESVAAYYEREFGARVEPSEVMATAGGKQAIFNAVVTLLNPGDECLIPKPYWVTFPEIAVFAGAKPVFIETEETNFVLTVDQVERAERLEADMLPDPAGKEGERERMRCCDRQRRRRCVPLAGVLAILGTFLIGLATLLAVPLAVTGASFVEPR